MEENNQRKAVQMAYKFRLIDYDSRGQITPIKLQRVLKNGTQQPFNLETCRLIVNQFDEQRCGYIGLDKFPALWDYINEWKWDFGHFSEHMGFLSMTQLQYALTIYGYSFTSPFFNILLHHFDRTKSGRIYFDDFIHLGITLKRLTPPFRNADTDRDGRVNIHFEDFLLMVLAAEV